MDALQATLTTVQLQVAKVDGQITMQYLAGIYAIVAIQNELGPPGPNQPAYAGADVYKGTATVAADGTGSGSLAQTGSYLIFSQPSLSAADIPPPPGTFT